MKSLLLSFPDSYVPRESQIKALTEIEDAIKSGQKYIICCLPTGAGKSFIPATLANYSRDHSQNYLSQVNEIGGGSTPLQDVGGVYALTITKTLQDQYDDLFNHSSILKGRKNYTCATDSSFDCETAMFALPNTKDCECKCPYKIAKEQAIRSKFAVLNYSMYFKLHSEARKRQFIVCDEAADLEDELVNNFTLTIEYAKVLINKTNAGKLYSDAPGDVKKWLSVLKSDIESEINTIKSSMRKTKIKALIKGYAQRLSYLTRLEDSITTVFKSWDKCEYVTELDKDGVNIVPINVAPFAKSIFDSTETVILMSATISNPAILAQTLGIHEYKYIELESEFDPKKSPIYCSSTHQMNYKNMDLVLPKVIDMAEILWNKHNTEKGIIHCHTFRIVEEIQKRVKSNKRFLFRVMGYTNEKILENHKSSKDPTVLVSPSMDTGISLDGDLGRFQIIMKAPYLPLGSKRIKTLYERSKTWYDYKALNALIQAMGRCTRSKDDHSVTYIVDGTATQLLKRYYDKLPFYIKNRIQ